MYINFWYPVSKSDELDNKKGFRVRLLGLDFVAFRDAAGAAHVLSDTCIHRGGALGKGIVKDGCIQCPYHGWTFDGDGRCTSIPSLGDKQKMPARAKVDSYPVQEKYGIVFAFLGDLPEAERPPLYHIPEFDDPEWRANELVVFEVDYYYERSVENGLDPAHNEFVH
ncbi:MAG: Rieske 2Fe-2S domain-containing protein, partial [Gammaproteobacteria bacterium]